jgi:hypothetical protein
MFRIYVRKTGGQQFLPRHRNSFAVAFASVTSPSSASPSKILGGRGLRSGKKPWRTLQVHGGGLGPGLILEAYWFIVVPVVDIQSFQVALLHAVENGAMIVYV